MTINNLLLNNDKLFSTKELSQLLQVDESTIKRWTNKGKLNCFKTPGGHRKYSSIDISNFLHKYHSESISDKSKKVVKKTLDCKVLSEIYFSNALKGEKENLLEILLYCYQTKTPLATIYDKLLMKALHKVLTLRHNSKLSTTDEHIIVTSMTESIHKFETTLIKAAKNHKTALLGVRENSLKIIQFTALSHLLEASGWKVYNLGAYTSLGIFLDAIEKYSPKLVTASFDFVTHYQGEISEAEILLKKCEVNKSDIIFSNFVTNPGNLQIPAAVFNKLTLFNSFQEFLALSENLVKQV